MHEYRSFLKEIIEKFIDFMIASQHWSDTYAMYMKSFDGYLFSNYPKAEELTQEMVDTWCQKRESESINSCLARTNVVIALIRYMNKRDLTKVKEPDRPKPQKYTHLPHAFTTAELTRFFYECDHIKVPRNSKASLIRKLIICVIFRLMYCTGIRPNEARKLKRNEVDLKNGVLKIVQTKGHDQHYAAIHESMIDTLKEYDLRMEVLVPGRVYFFPNGIDGFQTSKWLREQFSKIWKSANPGTQAVSYDFRHNYATVNINSWIDDRFDMYARLYHLSKSMGHCSVEHTKYYYSIVPRMADILNDKCADSFDDLMPEVLEDEIW